MQLNHEQFAAIQSPSRNTVVIAGPGSGKTLVLVHRIEFVARFEPHNSIVAITYTNAAAHEIQDRVDRLYQGKVKLGFIGTIHGYALKLLREHGAEVLGLSPKLTVMDDEQAEDFLELVTCDLHVKASKKAVAEAVANLLTHHNLPKADVQTAPLSGAQLVAFEYFARQLRNGALSFDAILAYGARVAHRAAGVHHLLVDEYQDANDLTHALCTGVDSQKFFVGDPDQSIYGFTGGNVRHLVGLARMPAIWQTFFLKRNHRSARKICRTADALIAHNRLRVPKETEVVSADEGEVSTRVFEVPAQEWSAIAAGILALGREAVPVTSCAVLCRTNKLAAEGAAFLEGMGILVRKREWKDKPHDWQTVRRFIALCANPENDSLCYWFLALMGGAKTADKARLEAADAGRSLNRHTLKLPTDLDLAGLPAVLRKIDVSPDAVGLVQKAILTLAPGAGITELAVALGQADLHWQESGTGLVVVTTMHGAKGREFDAVFVAGADEEIIPAGRDPEEERRLMFVAVTRARRFLCLTSSRHRRVYRAGLEQTHPSSFIGEMGLA